MKYGKVNPSVSRKRLKILRSRLGYIIALRSRVVMQNLTKINSMTNSVQLVRVRVGIGYEMVWVRVGSRYELVRVRVGLSTSWHGTTWLGYELTGTPLDNTWPHKLYRYVGCDFPLAMNIIWHFLYWTMNFMPHALLHRSRESKSLCRASQCALEQMGWYMRQSSANSLICEVMTDGRSFMWSKNKRGPSTVPYGPLWRPKPFYNNPLDSISKKGFNPAYNGTIYAV